MRAAVVATLVFLSPLVDLPVAAADPVLLRVRSPSTLTTEKGAVVNLPPVRIVDEESWGTLEIEFKRLQDLETRLGAENKSLRASASSSRHWKFAIAALAVGFASGAAVAIARQ